MENFHPRRLHRKMRSFILRNIMGTITHVKTNEPVIALTFDDGPDPVHTPYLLEILRKYEAKVTFFIVGASAQRYPELVERIAIDGHAIGNHSWDHPSFPLITSKERKRQIRECDRVINNYSCKLFRPPYGDQSIRSRFDILLTGHKVINWNIVAMDWIDKSAEFLVERVSNQIKPGSIILFHDSLFTYQDKNFTDRSETLKAVDTILHKLNDHYRFITVPELLKYGRPNLVNWLQEPKIDYLKNLKSQINGSLNYLSKSLKEVQ